MRAIEIPNFSTDKAVNLQSIIGKKLFTVGNRRKKLILLFVVLFLNFPMANDVIEIRGKYGDYVSLADKNDINCLERNDNSLSYEDFFAKHLAPNKPCIFDSAVTANWLCRREWNEQGAPNFKILSEMFGDCKASIADCRKKHYNSHMTDDTRIKNYIDYWIEYREKNRPEDMPLLYLKDWHCVQNYPSLGLYEVPKYFASDWLNEYYTMHPKRDSDYMFVYMGPKGTWTPFHGDVFSSYSWSANILGKKRWLLFPPGEENALRDCRGHLAYDVTSEELRDSRLYPNYDEKSLKCLDVVQLEGEIIFVPSGWHHQVWNLEDTISVNHNWINGCNVLNAWEGLKKEFAAVTRELEDCRGMERWDEERQLVLKASHGMDYHQFYEFLEFVAKRRLQSLRGASKLKAFEKWTLGRDHCLFDLQRVEIVLEDMIRHTELEKIHQLIFPDNSVHEIIHDINYFVLR